MYTTIKKKGYTILIFIKIMRGFFLPIAIQIDYLTDKVVQNLSGGEKIGILGLLESPNPKMITEFEN